MFVLDIISEIPLGAPRCGSGPNWCLEGSPPSPILIGGPFPQAKPLPSPPSPSLFPPPPLALFARLREGAAQAGGGRGPRVQGDGGGGPPSGTWGQTHIWGYSIPRRGHSRRGRCANLSQIARQICAKLLVFRFVHQRKGAQICRKSESQFRTLLCKYPFSNAPFLKVLFTPLIKGVGPQKHCKTSGS